MAQCGKDFKIRSSVRITEGSDNGDSDNSDPTVLIYLRIQVMFVRDHIPSTGYRKG